MITGQIYGVTGSATEYVGSSTVDDAEDCELLSSEAELVTGVDEIRRSLCILGIRRSELLLVLIVIGYDLSPIPYEDVPPPPPGHEYDIFASAATVTWRVTNDPEFPDESV